MLTVDSKHLDFGEVWETDKFECVVPITNTSGETVHVNHISGSCTCGRIEPTELVLAPAETKSLRLFLDLRANQVSEKTVSWEFKTSIWASAQGGDKVNNLSWDVRGNVKRLVRSPGAIDFGSLSELASIPHSRKLQLEPTAPVKSVTAEINTSLFAVAVTPPTPERGYEIVVTTNMGNTRGRYDGIVTLKFESVNGATLPTVQLPVRAEIVGDVETIPASILGSVPTGSELTETVTLRSLTNANLEIQPVANPQMTIRSVGSHSYEVKTKISAMGSQVTSLKFLVRANGKEPMEVVVPITIYGQMP